MMLYAYKYRYMYYLYHLVEAYWMRVLRNSMKLAWSDSVF